MVNFPSTDRSQTHSVAGVGMASSVFDINHPWPHGHFETGIVFSGGEDKRREWERRLAERRG